jgi:hypothetical protein
MFLRYKEDEQEVALGVTVLCMKGICHHNLLEVMHLGVWDLILVNLTLLGVLNRIIIPNAPRDRLGKRLDVCAADLNIMMTMLNR